MTWHAKALTTSYVTAPGAGAQGRVGGRSGIPLHHGILVLPRRGRDDAHPQTAFAIVAFGDSITDGTASTMNGDDRWPDVLSRRLKALHGNKVAVVNAGIGGNQIAGPAEYGPDKPFPGGPASGQRLDRDVLALSGVSSLIWLEGINDFSKNGNASADQVHRGDEGRRRPAAAEMAAASRHRRHRGFGARQHQRRARLRGAGSASGRRSTTSSAHQARSTA